MRNTRLKASTSCRRPWRAFNHIPYYYTGRVVSHTNSVKYRKCCFKLIKLCEIIPGLIKGLRLLTAPVTMATAMATAVATTVTLLLMAQAAAMGLVPCAPVPRIAPSRYGR